MKIESAAGEFEFDIESLKVENDKVILTGKMGVWEAETSMSRQDTAKLIKMMLGTPTFWLYVLKLPFTSRN